MQHSESLAPLQIRAENAGGHTSTKVGQRYIRKLQDQVKERFQHVDKEQQERNR
jgi:hypothetical protein